MKSLRAFIRWRETVLKGQKSIGLIERNGHWYLEVMSPGNAWKSIPVPAHIQISRLVKALN
jgi:hypothetical protein